MLVDITRSNSSIEFPGSKNQKKRKYSYLKIKPYKVWKVKHRKMGKHSKGEEIQKAHKRGV